MSRWVGTFLLITILTFVKLSSAGPQASWRLGDLETSAEERGMDADEIGMNADELELDAEDRGRPCKPCCKKCEKDCDDWESTECKRCFKKAYGCKKCRKYCILASDKCWPGFTKFEYRINNAPRVKRCYYFSKDEEVGNFTVVRDICQKMGPYPFFKPHLATPTTSEEFNFIGYNIETRYPNRVDYNLTTLGAKGEEPADPADSAEAVYDSALWYWINGEPVNTQNPPLGPWMYEFPNSNYPSPFSGLCGAYLTVNDTLFMPLGSGMVNLECDYPNAYVCQYDPKN